MVVPPVLIVVFIVVLYVISSIKILAEYERGVIFRLGKLLPQPKGPGVILVFVPIDRMVRVSLRTVALEVPPQDVITRDNVSVKVSAVLYYRVIDPRRAIVEVENYQYATLQLAQTTLRSVLGQAQLDDLLAERDRLNQQLQQILDQHAEPWGIKVSAVEVKHVDLPENMQRSMARQAEAEREKRAKIIHAAGELEASGQAGAGRRRDRLAAARASRCGTCRRSPKSPRRRTRRSSFRCPLNCSNCSRRACESIPTRQSPCDPQSLLGMNRLRSRPSSRCREGGQ